MEEVACELSPQARSAPCPSQAVLCAAPRRGLESGIILLQFIITIACIKMHAKKITEVFTPSLSLPAVSPVLANAGLGHQVAAGHFANIRNLLSSAKTRNVLSERTPDTWGWSGHRPLTPPQRGARGSKLSLGKSPP